MCLADGGDTPEFSRSTSPIARTQHKCCECGRKIMPGERYHYTFMVYEGSPDTFATCRHCQVGHRWLVENCGGYLFHALHDEMQEHVDEYPDLSFGLRRIKLGIERQWQRRDATGLIRVPDLPRAIESVMAEAL